MIDIDAELKWATNRYSPWRDDCRCDTCKIGRLVNSLATERAAANARIAELEAEVSEAIARARLHSSYVTEFEALTSANYRNIQRIGALRTALRSLHDETAEYITINNLGDPWHNQSMKNAKAALDKEPT